MGYLKELVEQTRQRGLAEQRQWLERIRQHLAENLTIDHEDFEVIPILADAGGWGRANRAFDGNLSELVQTLNEAIAA